MSSNATEATEQTEQPQIVERDDFNNSNLTRYEVTHTDGTVEVVEAHFVDFPSRSFFGKDEDSHIKFTGYYSGRHATALVVQSGRVQQIRNLSLLPPSPRFALVDPFGPAFDDNPDAPKTGDDTDAPSL